MTIELCDLCKKGTPDRSFKMKMATKGRYERNGNIIAWRGDLWNPYKKIFICEDCAERLFGIESSKTFLQRVFNSIKPKNQ